MLNALFPFPFNRPSPAVDGVPGLTTASILRHSLNCPWHIYSHERNERACMSACSFPYLKSPLLSNFHPPISCLPLPLTPYPPPFFSLSVLSVIARLVYVHKTTCICMTYVYAWFVAPFSISSSFPLSATTSPLPLFRSHTFSSPFPLVRAPPQSSLLPTSAYTNTFRGRASVIVLVAWPFFCN